MGEAVSALATAGVIFSCLFGAALLGLLLRTRLPEHHLSSESKDVVKLGMGLLATMAALVLSLLIASAKTSHDTRRTELIYLAANVILLDRLMAHYGPDARAARDVLRTAMSGTLDQMWPPDGAPPRQRNPRAMGGEAFYDTIEALSPQGEAQRLVRAEALKIATDIGRTRWLLFEQAGGSIPLPFLALLVFWIAVIFVSFGLFAPRNTTVIVTLFVCAVSVSGALFLILEWDQPFQGFIQISSGPLRSALATLGQ